MSKIQYYLEVDGVKGNPIYEVENIRFSLTYQPEDGDLFVSSYPRTGSNWTRQMIYLLRKDGIPPANGIMDLIQEIVRLDHRGQKTIERNPRPKVFSYHLTYDRIPMSANAKYIYVVRNPKDTCVSYFYYLTGFFGLKMTFEQFFESFITGDIMFGDYFEHLKSWYGHRHDSNVLFLRFEEMKKDPRSTVHALANFLGEEFKAKIEQRPELVDDVLKYSTVEFMKSNMNEETNRRLRMKIKRKGWDTDESGQFVRKGEVGSWKVVLSPAQAQKIDQRFGETFGCADWEDLWRE